MFLYCGFNKFFFFSHVARGSGGVTLTLDKDRILPVALYEYEVVSCVHDATENLCTFVSLCHSEPFVLRFCGMRAQSPPLGAPRRNDPHPRSQTNGTHLTERPHEDKSSTAKCSDAAGARSHVFIETSVAVCFANFNQSSPSSDAAASAPRCLLIERFT